MAHQLDRTLDEVDSAMTQLKRAIRGIPVRREGFKAHHDKLTKSMGRLTVALEDSRSRIQD
jgi:hypothetical protein